MPILPKDLKGSDNSDALYFPHARGTHSIDKEIRSLEKQKPLMTKDDKRVFAAYKKEAPKYKIQKLEELHSIVSTIKSSKNLRDRYEPEIFDPNLQDWKLDKKHLKMLHEIQEDLIDRGILVKAPELVAGVSLAANKLKPRL